MKAHEIKLVDERISELGLILQAFVFAADKHRHQRRKGDSALPYINHPIELANVLYNEAGITEPAILCAAILHDTLEDTDTTADDIARRFGEKVRDIVVEVSDDRRLPKIDRKRLQIEHAPNLSLEARLVKLADKICNLRDILETPPSGWNLTRKQEYFDWARAVVDGLRGVNPTLERLFDEVYARRPES